MPHCLKMTILENFTTDGWEKHLRHKLKSSCISYQKNLSKNIGKR